MATTEKLALASKEQGAKEKPLCFVISQIGAENSPERARADKVLRHVIKKALDSKYRIERADEIGKPGVITVQIIQRLASAELVIADLTGGNPNVYYELALRHYFAKPVVRVIERGAKAPFDVSPMRYVEFDLKEPDVLDNAREELVRQVEAMEKGEKVVTLVQLAGLLEEPKAKQGDATFELVKAVYASVENVAAQVSRIEGPQEGGFGSGLGGGFAGLRQVAAFNLPSSRLRGAQTQYWPTNVYSPRVEWGDQAVAVLREAVGEAVREELADLKGKLEEMVIDSDSPRKDAGEKKKPDDEKK